jgi:hypothetical protein
VRSKKAGGWGCRLFFLALTIFLALFRQNLVRVSGGGPCGEVIGPSGWFGVVSCVGKVMILSLTVLDGVAVRGSLEHVRVDRSRVWSFAAG